MKTYTANQAAYVAANPDVSTIWVIQIDWPSPTGTKYYSTREKVPITGISPEYTVHSAPQVSREIPLFASTSFVSQSASFTLLNLPEDANRVEIDLEDNIGHNLPVKVYSAFDTSGAVAVTQADLLLQGSYVINETENNGVDRIAFSLRANWFAEGTKEIGRVLTRALAPNAPREALGVIIPHIIGKNVENCRGIPLSVGKQTLLDGGLDETTVDKIFVSRVRDSSGVAIFSESGAILIGEEPISYTSISPAGSSSQYFANCTRGPTPTTHEDRAQVIGVLGGYDYLFADTAVDEFTTLQIEDGPVLIEGTDYTLLNGSEDIDGRAVTKARFTSPPSVRRQSQDATADVWENPADWADSGSTADNPGGAFDGGDDANATAATISVKNGQGLLSLDFGRDLTGNPATLTEAYLEVTYAVQPGVSREDADGDFEWGDPEIKIWRDGTAYYGNYLAKPLIEASTGILDHTDVTGSLGTPEEGTTPFFGRASTRDVPAKIVFVSKANSIAFSPTRGVNFFPAYANLTPGIRLDFPVESMSWNVGSADIIDLRGFPWLTFSVIDFDEDLIIESPTIIAEVEILEHEDGITDARIEMSLLSGIFAHQSTSAGIFTGNPSARLLITIPGLFSTAEIASWVFLIENTFRYKGSAVDEFPRMDFKIRFIEFRGVGAQSGLVGESQAIIPNQTIVDTAALVAPSAPSVQRFNITSLLKAPEPGEDWEDDPWKFFNTGVNVQIQDFGTHATDILIYSVRFVTNARHWRTEVLDPATAKITATISARTSGGDTTLDIAELLIENADYLNLSPSDWDSSSFTAAAGKQRLARRIGEKVKTRDAVGEFLFAAGVRGFQEGGVIKFASLALPDGSSAVTLDQDSILTNPAITKKNSSLNEVQNRIIVNYKRDYREEGGRMLGAVQIDDTASQSLSWGIRPEFYAAEWIQREADALTLANLIAARRSQRWTRIVVPLPGSFFDLETGDQTIVTHTRARLSNAVGEVGGLRIVNKDRVSINIAIRDTKDKTDLADGVWYEVSPGGEKITFYIDNTAVASVDSAGVWRFKGGWVQTLYDATTTQSTVVDWNAGQSRISFGKWISDGPAVYGRVMEIDGTGTVYVYSAVVDGTYPKAVSVTDFIDSPTGTTDVLFSGDLVNGFAAVGFFVSLEVPTSSWQLQAPQIILDTEIN